MYKTSAGFHRLGILVGSLATFCLLAYIMIDSNGFTGIHLKGWIVILLVSTAIFLLGYGVIAGIHWVTVGFGPVSQTNILGFRMKAICLITRRRTARLGLVTRHKPSTSFHCKNYKSGQWPRHLLRGAAN